MNRSDAAEVEELFKKSDIWATPTSGLMPHSTQM